MYKNAHQYLKKPLWHRATSPERRTNDMWHSEGQQEMSSVLQARFYFTFPCLVKKLSQRPPQPNFLTIQNYKAASFKEESQNMKPEVKEGSRTRRLRVTTSPQVSKPHSSLGENTSFLPCWGKKNHITIQMCSFKEAFLKTSPRHSAPRSSALWQEMINYKRGLTSLEGDIILRTDIALWDRVYNNTITTISRRRLPPQPLAVDNPGLNISWSAPEWALYTILYCTRNNTKRYFPM